MKKWIVFGAGNNGVHLAQMLQNKDICKTTGNVEIKFFADNAAEKWGDYVYGIPVIAPEEIRNYKDKVDGICISTSKEINSIIKQISDMDIDLSVYMTPDYVYRYMWGPDMPAFAEIDITKPFIPVLEYLIVDHCILKCKGCLTASNIRKARFDSPDNFERTMKRIKELFSGVGSLRILGGEAFLHKDIADFIWIARNLFPTAEIVIISNGLLIPSLPDEVVRLLHKLDIVVSISQYQPTGERQRAIENVLKANCVRYHFRGAVYTFRKSINMDGKYDIERTFKRCGRCPSVINDTLACEKYQEIQLLKQVFHFDIGEWVNDLGIDIFSTEMSGWEINDFLSKPSRLCAYCATYSGDPNIEYKWECNHTDADLGDWIYQETEPGQ